MTAPRSEPVRSENGRLLGFVEPLLPEVCAWPMFRCRDALGALLRWSPLAKDGAIGPPRLFQTASDAAAYVRARATAAP